MTDYFHMFVGSGGPGKVLVGKEKKRKLCKKIFGVIKSSYPRLHLRAGTQGKIQGKLKKT